LFDLLRLQREAGRHGFGQSLAATVQDLDTLDPQEIPQLKCESPRPRDREHHQASARCTDQQTTIPPPSHLFERVQPLSRTRFIEWPAVGGQGAQPLASPPGDSFATSDRSGADAYGCDGFSSGTKKDGRPEGRPWG
jgi:hypothetical protein